MLLNTPQLVSALLGVLIPLINGLLTRYAASTVRVYLQIVLSAVAGFGTEWASAGAGFSFGQALSGWLLTLVTALAVEAKVWAPLGVSEAVKRMGV
jgi:hypothetical protein